MNTRIFKYHTTARTTSSVLNWVLVTMTAKTIKNQKSPHPPNGGYKDKPGDYFRKSLPIDSAHETLHMEHPKTYWLSRE